jgi:hypothetical protein
MGKIEIYRNSGYLINTPQVKSEIEPLYPIGINVNDDTTSIEEEENKLYPIGFDPREYLDDRPKNQAEEPLLPVGVEFDKTK